MLFREIPFDPCPLLGHPHLQTVVPVLLSWHKDPGSESFPVELPDGDKLILEITTPSDWRPTDPTVLCVHGFGGSHQSVYMVRMASKLSDVGIRVIRFNVRGAGSGKGHAKKIYNLNFANDLYLAIEKMKQLYPDSLMTLIGFSLGGNVVLRLLGDLEETSKNLIHQAISVAPPVDLSRNPGLQRSLYQGANWAMDLYDRYFYSLVKNSFEELSDFFSEVPKGMLPQKSSIFSFSEAYLAPVYGDCDVMEYYRKGSAIHTIQNIHVPCKILFSQDDPLVLHHLLDQHTLPEHVEVYKTEKGGHMGYLGDPRNENGFYWMDSLLIRWIQEGFQ